MKKQNRIRHDQHKQKQIKKLAKNMYINKQEIDRGGRSSKIDYDKVDSEKISTGGKYILYV